MITQEKICELFTYKEGELFRIRTTSSRSIEGSKVGWTSNPDAPLEYKRVRIGKRTYFIHSLIYIYHYGSVPKGLQVDHINRNKFDNRIENLRLVTAQENQFNREAKGYSYDRQTGKYKASIKLNGKSYNLGRYNTEEEANKAYLNAKKEMHIIKELHE